MSIIFDFFADHVKAFWWIFAAVNTTMVFLEAITLVVTYQRTRNKFVLTTSLMMLISSLASVAINLNHLSDPG